MSDPTPKKRKLSIDPAAAPPPSVDSEESDDPDDARAGKTNARGGKGGKPVRKYASACQFCRRRKVRLLPLGVWVGLMKRGVR